MEGFSFTVGFILGCLSIGFVIAVEFTVLGKEWHCTKQQAIEGTMPTQNECITYERVK